VIIVATGFAGGAVSGLLGIGENMVAFIIMALLFRIPAVTMIIAGIVLVPQQAMLARTCFPTSILSPATGRRATRPAAPM
jgi:uncharacterized membrane protein YfcA